MKPLSLRLRLAAFFAAAVAGALVLFAIAVVVVLRVDDDDGPPATSSDTREDVQQVLAAMALLAPFAVGGAAGLGLVLAKRAVGPLREASERARAAQDSALELELPVTGRGDEWDDLAATMNALLRRTRDSVERVRRFTADAAHELRTPLTTIVGESDLALRRERSPAELRAALEVVHGEGLRLRELVSTLLALARADAGNLPLHAQPMDLHQAVQDAVNRVSRTAERMERSVTFESRLAPARVAADPSLLGRALDNLLENAVLHGGGRVHVTLAVHDTKARVEVADDGPGVPAALRPHLFERFATADASRTRGGTGLGLALARSIAEAHGGALSYVEGEGARFWLELPVDVRG